MRKDRTLPFEIQLSRVLWPAIPDLTRHGDKSMPELHGAYPVLLDLTRYAEPARREFSIDSWTSGLPQDHRSATNVWAEELFEEELLGTARSGGDVLVRVTLSAPSDSGRRL
jgi:hypothetical protein